jgi:hypothetical protein
MFREVGVEVVDQLVLVRAGIVAQRDGTVDERFFPACGQCQAAADAEVPPVMKMVLSARCMIVLQCLTGRKIVFWELCWRKHSCPE